MQPKEEEAVIKRAITIVKTAINRITKGKSHKPKVKFQNHLLKTITTKFGNLSQNLTGNILTLEPRVHASTLSLPRQPYFDRHALLDLNFLVV